MALEDGRTRPAIVSVLTSPGRESMLEITIHEGRNRMVRRMLEAVGHPVRALERVAFGPLELGPAASGRLAEGAPPELEELRRRAGLAD